jgi:hypothetical protein
VAEKPRLSSACQPRTIISSSTPAGRYPYSRQTRWSCAPLERLRNMVATGDAHRIAFFARPALRQYATSTSARGGSSGVPAVEVRRALPAVPRAIALTSAVSSVSKTEWQPIRMPDGSVVQASYQGELPSSAALPARGRFIGEEYSTGNTTWIWMTPAGASFPSWVDP